MKLSTQADRTQAECRPQRQEVVKQLIFISSTQKELAAERRALKDYIEGDALLSEFFDVFLFEDMPASGRRADKVYLKEVGRCDIYLGLFGNDYGYEDADGVSPTEREFDRATDEDKERLIFIKGNKDSDRHPKMRNLVRKVGNQLIRRRFTETTDLIHAVYASLVDYLRRTGTIQGGPFDEQPCPKATLDDIDSEAVTTFVRTARAERKFPLKVETPMAKVLAHLDMLADGRPTRAAILLFGHKPQRFMPNAEIRCMHFHGTEIRRPAPYYDIFKGTLFEQVDQATNFVLTMINHSIGIRDESAQAPVIYEIPRDVIREAIVNAIAHRDYASAAAIQVSVFSDRVEVWNPGMLPPPLTLEQLRHPHRSIARNTKVCEGLFLARYIEKYGTGTLMMIEQSIEHALPEPDFGQQAGEFSATVWRDWLTTDVLTNLRLNTRQLTAIQTLKTSRVTTAQIYQQLTRCARRTAIRDLEELMTKGVVRRDGVGRAMRYILAKKEEGGGMKEALPGENTNRAIIVPIVPSPDATATPKTAKKARISGKKAQVETKLGPSQQTVNRPSRVTPPTQSSDPVSQLIRALEFEDKSAGDLRKLLGIKHRPNFRENYLHPALQRGFIKLTLPDKPNSRLQKYRLTIKGRAHLAKRKR
ncbi:MAG: DUF4062 domain-containing protein [Phycisphaerales bacterium]|nr:DUF4062 domain-containing protein [Phycisphaerales bacterium]